MIRILLALIVCCLAVSSPAAPAPAPGNAPKSKPTPAPDGQRFLFIVETSSAMGRMQAETEAALFELIGSGVYRQMRPGDTYGLWTYNRETFAGEFPMQIWDSRNSTQLGTIAAAYLSERDFEKSGDVKRMISTLNTVIHSISNLNILIISNGDSPMSGTPFDKSINAEYKAQRRERSKVKKPFVTSLVAREGWIIDSSVVIAGVQIKLPERPVNALVEKKPTPAPKPVVAPTRTNSVTPQTATAPKASSAPPATPVTPVPATSLAATTDPAAQPPIQVPAPRPRVMQIITKSNTVETTPTIAAAAPIAAEPTAVATSAPTNAPAQVATLPEPPAATASTIAAAPTPAAALAEPSHEPAPLESALAALLPKPIEVAARELHTETDDAKPQAPSPIPAAALPAANRLQPEWMLGFGGVLLAAAAFLIFVVFRRYRSLPQGSLITQSMDQR